MQTKYFLWSMFKEYPFWLVNCCSYSRWHIHREWSNSGVWLRWPPFNTHTGCSFAAADATPFWISFLLLTEQWFPLSCASVLRGLFIDHWLAMKWAHKWNSQNKILWPSWFMRIMCLFFCLLRGVLTITVFSTLKWRHRKCGAIDSKGRELGDALWPGGLPYGISGGLVCRAICSTHPLWYRFSDSITVNNIFKKSRYHAYARIESIWYYKLKKSSFSFS